MTKNDINVLNKIKKLLAFGKMFGYWDHGYDFPRRAKQIFQDVDQIKSKNLLEIGCGKGLFSIIASIYGAKIVVGLEPLEQGSGSFEQSKIYHEFNKIVDGLDLDRINILSETIQRYQNNGILFDLVLSNASVNHLDEESCVDLNKNQDAREKYLGIFRGIANKMNRGGKFILIDCSNRNLFGDLGVTNPMEKSIEWYKHQTPEIWAAMLIESGFGDPHITWPSGRFLRYLHIYNRNKFLSYLLDSSFRLEVTRL